MVANHSPFPLDFKEAHDLADLGGIIQDLEWVIEVGRLYEKKMPTEKYAFSLFEALSAAMIVRYGRAFATGVRRRIPSEWIKSLPEEDQENHNYFIELRNKFIAHSVNDFEEDFSVAYIKFEEGKEPLFDQVQTQHHRVVHIGFNKIKFLISLAQKMLKKAAAQKKIEKESVTEIARGIPVKKIVKTSLAISHNLGSGVSKSRRKRN